MGEGLCLACCLGLKHSGILRQRPLGISWQKSTTGLRIIIPPSRQPKGDHDECQETRLDSSILPLMLPRPRSASYVNQGLDNSLFLCIHISETHRLFRASPSFRTVLSDTLLATVAQRQIIFRSQPRLEFNRSLFIKLKQPPHPFPVTLSPRDAPKTSAPRV